MARCSWISTTSRPPQSRSTAGHSRKPAYSFRSRRASTSGTSSSGRHERPVRCALLGPDSVMSTESTTHHPAPPLIRAGVGTLHAGPAPLRAAVRTVTTRTRQLEADALLKMVGLVILTYIWRVQDM